MTVDDLVLKWSKSDALQMMVIQAMRKTALSKLLLAANLPGHYEEEFSEAGFTFVISVNATPEGGHRATTFLGMGNILIVDKFWLKDGMIDFSLKYKAGEIRDKDSGRMRVIAAIKQFAPSLLTENLTNLLK